MLLYQPHLTDEQIDEINTGACPHTAYTRAMFLDDSNAWGRVSDALPYYQHSANVKADTPEEVFGITNVGPDGRIERLGKLRSGSVGDVILSAYFGTDKRGWVCLPFGWLELTQDQIHFFLTKVSTVMRMGEPV